MSNGGEHGTRKDRRVGVSDQPIVGRRDDSLGLGEDARALAEFVAGCVTPLTIAIQGDWGSGKTSLLRMIEEHLDPPSLGKTPERVKVVRFETWQYAQFGGGPALPLSLLAMLGRKLSPPGAGAAITETLKKLARPAANAAIRAATAGLSELGDYASPDARLDFAEECDRLRRELADAVERKISREGLDRIVVLIDDLDRIKPALAVDLLETIKMFLNLDHCVFVLALDFAVVKEGVAAKLGINDERKARAFFDKIIQLPFQVPVAKYDTGGFVQHLLDTLGLASDGTVAVVELSRASVTTNPRAIKRVVNALDLTRRIAAGTFDRLGDRRDPALVVLFGLLCLQTRYPEAYAWLLAQDQPTAALRRAAEPSETDGATGEIAFADAADAADFPVFARLMADHADALSPDEFADMLGVTRATSVGEQATTFRFSADLHAENRTVMAEVLDASRTALPGVAIASAEKGRREAIRLTAEPQPGITLALEHGKTWLGLSVETAASERGKVLAALPNATLAADGSIHVWSVGVHDTTRMWRRKELLADAPEHFAAAWRRLAGQPDAA